MLVIRVSLSEQRLALWEDLHPRRHERQHDKLEKSGLILPVLHSWLPPVHKEGRRQAVAFLSVSLFEKLLLQPRVPHHMLLNGQRARANVADLHGDLNGENFLRMVHRLPLPTAAEVAQLARVRHFCLKLCQQLKVPAHVCGQHGLDDDGAQLLSHFPTPPRDKVELLVLHDGEAVLEAVVLRHGLVVEVLCYVEAHRDEVLIVQVRVVVVVHHGSRQCG
mmetsp:Transcript_16489/g.29407  ORF Transcript_16489/g.29407 Transcript_16489/m.29407 type:complete len:220 (+) Transcript_16489:90-749(+)